MFIETETTPNPATLKFLPGQRVMPSGTRDFASPEDAEASPLAQALFDTGEVTGVLFGANFVAVTAGHGADWGTLKPQVVAVLLDHFISQSPLFTVAGNGIAVPSEDDADGLLYPDDPAQAEIVEQSARPWPMTAAISATRASTKAWSICRCRAPVRAVPAPPPRSRTGSRGC
jgi:hypothetical protein